MSITRAQFFALTGLDVDTHTALKRRDLMPVNNAAIRAYTPFEAYAYLLAARFSELRAGDRVGSCAIVRDMLRQLVVNAPAIEASTIDFRQGGTAPEVFCGRIWTVGGGHEPFVGTKDELAYELTTLDIVDVLVTSATAGLVILQVRANREGVDLVDMWPDWNFYPIFGGGQTTQELADELYGKRGSAGSDEA
jgi:hypothetical protein